MVTVILLIAKVDILFVFPTPVYRIGVQAFVEVYLRKITVLQDSLPWSIQFNTISEYLAYLEVGEKPRKERRN